MLRRNRAVALALAFALSAVVAGPGCSNLVVNKVPVDKRAKGCDLHQKGFRYYLNRPYLVVKDPVLIAERRTYVEVKGYHGGLAQVAVKFLDGPRKGETVPLAELKVNAGGGEFRPVSAAELTKVHGVLSAQVAEVPAASVLGGPRRDPAVLQASAEADGVRLSTFNGESTTLEAAPAAQVPAGAAGIAPTVDGAASSVDNSSSSTQSLKDQTLPTNLPTDDSLSGPMKIVYLPDLDEQYSVRSKNWLAKSSFALVFRNGTELAEVDAEHDATTVTIALLDLVQKAVGVAQGVEQTRIQQAAAAKKQSGTQGGAGAGANLPELTELGVPTDKPMVYQMVERIYIQKGVYRLNKPWEVNGPGADKPTGFGLLAKLGLPTRSDVYFTAVGTLSDAK
jgi:hypothetical protein